MIIDNKPLINILNRTITVEYRINSQREISIFVNGLLSIEKEDIQLISANTIQLKDNIGIDWEYDIFSIIYIKK